MGRPQAFALRNSQRLQGWEESLETRRPDLVGTPGFFALAFSTVTTPNRLGFAGDDHGTGRTTICDSAIWWPAVPDVTLALRVTKFYKNL